MSNFIDDCETMEFPNQRRDDFASWCQVQLREPKSTRQPYNQENWSVYLTMWEGQRTGIFLTSKQARKIASWLLEAAELIDERNNSLFP